jgi:hypothetical protein
MGYDWRGIKKLTHNEQIGPYGNGTKVRVSIRDIGKSNLPQQPFRTALHVEIISQPRGFPRDRWPQWVKLHTCAPNIILVVGRCRNGDIMPPPLRGYGHRQKRVQIPKRTKRGKGNTHFQNAISGISKNETGSSAKTRFAFEDHGNRIQSQATEPVFS